MENSVSKKLPIIAMDYTPWEGNWMNRQHILSRLGKRGWPIIYSNGAKYYNEVNITKPFGSIKSKDHVKIYSSGYLLPRNYKFKALDRLAIRKHCMDLKKAANIKKGDDFIAFCFHPGFYPYIAELNAPYVMFHIYDVYQKLDSNKDENNSLAPVEENNSLALIEKADLITAASEDMWNEVVQTSKFTPNIIYNGVNYSNFENIKTMDHNIIGKINSISGYKVGYVGAINLKIDFELIYNVATKNKEINFLFIGNIVEKPILNSKKAAKYYHKCCQAGNIHFLGPIPKELVPQMLTLMDINAIFYTQNDKDWVQAGYPIKINEYLATGKPVVTSFMPVLKRHFESNITICNSVDEWSKALVLACQGKGAGTMESRKKMAKKNDWNNRVDQLEKLMSEMIKT